MEFKEFNWENGGEINISKLITQKLSADDYKKINSCTVISCHDVIIDYNGKCLLITRNNFPAKGELWVLGGRIEKGLSIEESLKKRVKEESNLDIYDINFLGCCRTFFKTDPFNHGNGVDSINLIFYAKARGELKLDNFHKDPILLSKNDYNSNFKEKLNPFVKYILDLGMPLIGR